MRHVDSANPSSPVPAPRRRWLPHASAAFVPILVLGLSLSFELARAESRSKSDEEPIRGKAEVVKQGVIEVKDHKFKLYGIVNPKGGQDCQRGAKPWNCAEGARNALRRHIDGHKVSCVPEESDHDVARCHVGDTDISALLVREGWARADRDVSGKRYIDEEKEARKARRGIWATDDENPEEVRRQQQRQ